MEGERDDVEEGGLRREKEACASIEALVKGRKKSKER